MDKIVNDRDVIGRQLIDKQMEIDNMKREVNSAISEVQRCEREIHSKKTEIQQLNQEVGNLLREREILSRKALKADELQQELNLVSDQLQKEKARLSDVELEQQNPINVHRWRLLKGKDPGMNELMQKLEAYQDILKKKNKTIAERVRLRK